MNHHGLFSKLMQRRIPSNLLALLEWWFSIGVTCVKWYDAWSSWFSLSCGIRQGGALSPYLFAIYVDSLVEKIKSNGYGCYKRYVCCSILLYADDILLVSPSVSSLQSLIHICEAELDSLDMRINVKKSACIRIGPRYNSKCNTLTTLNGSDIQWVGSLRYLGIHLSSWQKFSCSLDHAKKSFYRSFNCIFGKIGRRASEEVIIELLKSKCLPCMYYGLEACPINKGHIKSLEFALNSCFRKIFCTKSFVVAADCVLYFNCSINDAIVNRKTKFLTKLQFSANSLCQAVIDSIAMELAQIQRQ
jgi:hypothetical protein